MAQIHPIASISLGFLASVWEAGLDQKTKTKSRIKWQYFQESHWNWNDLTFTFTFTIFYFCINGHKRLKPSPWYLQWDGVMNVWSELQSSSFVKSMKTSSLSSAIMSKTKKNWTELSCCFNILEYYIVNILLRSRHWWKGWNLQTKRVLNKKQGLFLLY